MRVERSTKADTHQTGFLVEHQPRAEAESVESEGCLEAAQALGSGQVRVGDTGGKHRGLDKGNPIGK